MLNLLVFRNLILSELSLVLSDPYGNLINISSTRAQVLVPTMLKLSLVASVGQHSLDWFTAPGNFPSKKI